MSDELRMAFGALMEALDKELSQKEARINDLIAYTQHIDVENNKLRQNLKKTAGILASAANALQGGV
jgi:hypothetical protein